MAQRFQGRTVVITGASSGIGEAAARRFAAEGANVVLAARSEPTLAAVAADIRSRGGEALAVPTDVCDAAGCARLLAAAEERYGAVHVLVNNAGFNARGPVEEAPAEDLAHVVDTNLRAAVVLTRLALPFLRRARRGAIVNVASLAGRIPVPQSATYSATKFGLRAFSFALAEELRSTGITVSVVSPGPVETGFILEDLDGVPDVIFSQPVSTADEIAALVLDCAHDGARERAHPRVSGTLTTLGYLLPSLQRLLQPMLLRRGRKAKEALRRRAQQATQSATR